MEAEVLTAPPAVKGYTLTALVTALFERLAVYVSGKAHPGYGPMAAPVPRPDDKIQFQAHVITHHVPGNQDAFVLSEADVNGLGEQLGRAVRDAGLTTFIAFPNPGGVELAVGQGPDGDPALPTVRAIAVYDVTRDCYRIRVDVGGEPPASLKGLR